MTSSLHSPTEHDDPLRTCRARVLRRLASPRERAPGALAAQAGASFVELLTAVAIVGAALLVTLQQMTISYRETEQSLDRVFAYQKALGILAEIQAAVQGGEADDPVLLEAYDDGGVHNPVLTTLEPAGVPVAPDHPTSGNLTRQGEWLWWRRVAVAPMPSSDQMRYVSIRVERRLSNGRFLPAASISAVVNLPVESYPTRQVHDVYVLALGEVVSSLGPLDRVRTLFEEALAKSRSARPGLDYRVHWITKSGYGRDPRYAPYVNPTGRPTDDAPYVYWYPHSSETDDRLYNASLIDGRTFNGTGYESGYDSATNTVPYAVADRFNHASRFLPAARTHAARVFSGLERASEPPLQILLENFATQPERYKNAILVNLHGEVLPLPPLRNVSDPARAPTRLPGIRAVTHPERLWTPRDVDGNGDHSDTAPAAFRVYAYKSDAAIGSTVLSEPITLQILGADLTANVNRNTLPTGEPTLRVQCLPGGVDRLGTLAGDLAYSGFADAKTVTDLPQPQEMWFEVGYTSKPVSHTWIKLYNTPLVAPQVGSQGLATSQRLYGMEYIPSPILDDGTFAADLASTRAGSSRPVNTARWRIEVPANIFTTSVPGTPWPDDDTLVQVVTRIGSDTTTGTMWPTANEPVNVSETLTWWSASAAAVPLTERYQFQGDPRHYPYADGVAGGDSFPHGYNWYFDNLASAGGSVNPADWPCLDFTRLADGGIGGSEVDVPRFLHVWRTALQKSSIIAAQVSGPFAGAVALGGEITGVRPGGSEDPTPIQVHGDFFAMGAGVLCDELAATAPIGSGVASAPGGAAPLEERRGRTLVVDTGSGFWAKPWLGQLAPDTEPMFGSVGNLPSPRFCRTPRHLASPTDLPVGTSFDAAAGTYAGSDGTAAWFQGGGGTAGAVQPVQLGPGTQASAIDVEVLGLLRLVGFEPGVNSEWRWPFELGGPEPSLHHRAFASDYPAHEVDELERFAYVSGVSGGSVLALQAPGAPAAEKAIVMMSGMTSWGEPETAQLIGRTLALGVHALHVAGSPTLTGAFAMPELVSVFEPAPMETLLRPTEIVVRWRTRFTRFDGRPYTEAHGPEFTSDESDLGYVVLMSGDDGLTWTYAADGTPAEAGVWVGPSSPYWQADAGTGDESYAIESPVSRYPAGDYLIRIECYRASRATHHSYHQQAIRVER